MSNVFALDPEQKQAEDLGPSINLGAGRKIIPGWVNVDQVAMPGIDVVHDLDDVPWPWKDQSCGQIMAWDVYEHVDKPLHFMVEAHRVIKPGGLLRIHTCHIGYAYDAFHDPTHKRFLTHDSFDYWIAGTWWHAEYGLAYSLGNPDVKFRYVRKEVQQSLDVTLERL